MMFYTQLFTSKRGPLAKIWLAAHWERKLTKAHVFECNLETTTRDIISSNVKIGLRTSGHLLFGVVRIYSRKAKYLLSDCSDALLKIKSVFRPGQTDLPVEGLEATLKTITLSEDFTAFDSQLPDPSDIDVVDHFSLNQSRSEEITLKEEFGSGFLNLRDFGDESQSHQVGLLDVSFQSLTHKGDAFGDEDKGFDILDFLRDSSDQAEISDLIPEQPLNETPEPLNDTPECSALSRHRDADKMEARTPTPSETTLLPNEQKAFVLEPVAVTPNLEGKRGKRKRKLLVDQNKELSNGSIREQLASDSDLLVPMDMAPPTLQLMQWKESGGADKLFAQLCSTGAAQINKLFRKSLVQVKQQACEDVETMRQDGAEARRDMSAVTAENTSVADSSVDPERSHTELSVNLMDDSRLEDSSAQQDESRSGFSHPELPSEDSLFVHPSSVQQATQSTSVRTQSMLDSQDFEDRRLTRHSQKLLTALKSSSDSSFSLVALCEGGTRSLAATTFFCLLLLKKQQALELQQRAPYEDVVATPGPRFYEQ